ncbi:RNA-binding protein [Eupransor demetentiae]|uniref:Contains S4-like domain (YlmH) n=1 Tax=Eupransor demetentiae TaxID=3109584 RepID=A0ABP0ES45_9LACO|nr:RNA-binding protein YlmH [Lactobacillaceae bacterium LMG 33000]
MQHFNPDEADFVAQAQDWIGQAKGEYRPVLTHFLNPRQQYILHSLVNDEPELQDDYAGGSFNSEKKRGLLAPTYYEIQADDFELATLQLNYPAKFVDFRQADLLGAILNAGINREVLGDIVTDENHRLWQVMTEKNMAPFIEREVVQIGKNPVSWDLIPAQRILVRQDEGEESFLLLASLRLDVVIAAGFNIQRSKAQELITAGLVQVNWTICQKNNRIVSINDIISVRRFGRMRFLSLDGRSKKDKQKVVFNIIRR